MNAYRFNVPFKRPLTLKGRIYSHREGVLLEQAGNWAEASPLPGFSAETIDDVVAALRGEQQTPAALDFAMSSLNTPLPPQLRVPYNQLLIGDHRQVIDGAESCHGLNCRAVKLKVGQNNVAADVQLVREVSRRIPGHVQLRLDANQGWDFDVAVEFVKALEDVTWDYIEEPLKDPNQLEELYSQTGVRYALDESLRDNSLLERWPNAAAMICKPTVLGGQSAIDRLVATGKPVVFSAAFESGIGIARVMQIASKVSPQLAAGLDTLDWFAETLLQYPLCKQDGFMTLDSFAIDTTRLEQIEL